MLQCCFSSQLFLLLKYVLWIPADTENFVTLNANACWKIAMEKFARQTKNTSSISLIFKWGTELAVNDARRFSRNRTWTQFNRLCAGLAFCPSLGWWFPGNDQQLSIPSWKLPWHWSVVSIGGLLCFAQIIENIFATWAVCEWNSSVYVIRPGDIFMFLRPDAQPAMRHRHVLVSLYTCRALFLGKRKRYWV